MKIRDMIIMGFANLWQTKLRSTLTILGVVIGALSSMVSFGTGMQKNTKSSINKHMGYAGSRKVPQYIFFYLCESE